MTGLTDEELAEFCVLVESARREGCPVGEAGIDLDEFLDSHVKQIVDELRTLRLTAEEREALRWAVWMCCGGNKPLGGDYQEAVPLIRAVLARLVGES